MKGTRNRMAQWNDYSAKISYCIPNENSELRVLFLQLVCSSQALLFRLLYKISIWHVVVKKNTT